jgi:DNA-directed RNA polymerase subunit RPC12/RpoP
LWRQRYELDKSARVEFKPSEIGEMPIARPKYKCFFCGKDFEIIEIEYLQTCVNCKKIISEELKKS